MQQEPSTSPGSKQPETPEHELHLAFCRLGFKPTETRKKVFKELIFVAVNDQCKSAEVDDPATLSGQKLERFIEGTTLDIMDYWGIKLWASSAVFREHLAVPRPSAKLRSFMFDKDGTTHLKGLDKVTQDEMLDDKVLDERRLKSKIGVAVKAYVRLAIKTYEHRPSYWRAKDPDFEDVLVASILTVDETELKGPVDKLADWFKWMLDFVSRY